MAATLMSSSPRKTSRLLRRPAASCHHNTAPRIKAPARFVFNNCAQHWWQSIHGEDLESKSRVKRHVPGNIPKRRQCNRPIAGVGGPSAHVRDEARSEAATPVVWMDVDFFEMYGVGVEDLDMRKADRNVVGERDPQPALTLRHLQDFVAGRFTQDRLGRVSGKQPGRRELDLQQPNEIRWACAGDPVQRRHAVG